jgi:hypothetical protein
VEDNEPSGARFIIEIPVLSSAEVQAPPSESGLKPVAARV